MIPLIVDIKVRRHSRSIFRLWFPLFLVWLLLLPLVLVLLPIAVVVLAVLRMNPFRACSVGWQILVGLNGTRVEVDDGRASVFVHIF